MTNDPMELWARQARRTKEYKKSEALLEEREMCIRCVAEIDAVFKVAETDATFVAQFDHRVRRLTQQQLFCETQKAIAEARRVKPKRPPEEPTW
jgi:hypothetical protein